MPREGHVCAVAELVEVGQDSVDGGDGRDVVGDLAEARLRGVACVGAAELVGEEGERLHGEDVGELKEEQLGTGDEQAVAEIDKGVGRDARRADPAAGKRRLEARLRARRDHFDGAFGGGGAAERDSFERQDARGPAALGAGVRRGQVAAGGGQRLARAAKDPERAQGGEPVESQLHGLLAPPCWVVPENNMQNSGLP